MADGGGGGGYSGAASGSSTSTSAASNSGQVYINDTSVNSERGAVTNPHPNWTIIAIVGAVGLVVSAFIAKKL